MTDIYVVKDVLTQSYYNGHSTPLGMELVQYAGLAKPFIDPAKAKAWGRENCERKTEIEKFCRSKQFNAGAAAQQTISKLQAALDRSTECINDLRDELKLVATERDELLKEKEAAEYTREDYKAQQADLAHSSGEK
jgi:hypothetical protein